MEAKSTSRSKSVRYSTMWDVVVPLVIVAAPPLIFRIHGFFTQGLDKPNASMPVWLIVTVGVLNVSGIIAMAILILTRFEAAFQELSAVTDGRPPRWRKLALVLSVACLLVSDILANVGVAFGGAEFLFAAAMPIFLGYLLLKHFAFILLPISADTLPQTSVGNNSESVSS